MASTDFQAFQTVDALVASIAAGSGTALAATSITSSGDVTALKTITAAAPPTERLVRSELTLTPATTIAAASGGSLAGVRGLLTLTTGKTGTGFMYGTQGKFVGDGATIDAGSSHVAGVYAQMSLNGTTVTSGHVAPLMSVGQHLPTSDNVDLIYIENNDVTTQHAIIHAIADATYLIDAEREDGAATFVASSAGSSAGKYLVLKLGGTVYKIALLANS